MKSSPPLTCAAAVFVASLCIMSCGHTPPPAQEQSFSGAVSPGDRACVSIGDLSSCTSLSPDAVSSGHQGTEPCFNFNLNGENVAIHNLPWRSQRYSTHEEYSYWSRGLTKQSRTAVSLLSKEDEPRIKIIRDYSDKVDPSQYEGGKLRPGFVERYGDLVLQQMGNLESITVTLDAKRVPECK